MERQDQSLNQPDPDCEVISSPLFARKQSLHFFLVYIYNFFLEFLREGEFLSKGRVICGIFFHKDFSPFKISILMSAVFCGTCVISRNLPIGFHSPDDL